MGVVVGTTALVVSILVPLGAGATASCALPAAVPMREVAAGMVGTAWTVVEGTEPEPFKVRVLGVQADAVLPGFDLIIVKAYGPLIDRTGGIAAGFSGSPVWVNGKLLGSVSWSFDAGADPTIGALTPGAMLVDVASIPPASGRARLRVEPTRETRRAVTRATGRALAAGAVLQPIALPVAISGLPGPVFTRAANRLSSQGALAYRGGSARVAHRTSGHGFGPGDALAATLSYGDVTYAGIGTATFRCGARVVAFGHPFLLRGATRGVGVNGAEILATVNGDLFHFKLGNVTDLRGELDQDRWGGIRGILGETPALLPVRSSLTNRTTDRVLRGRTAVAIRSSWMRWIAQDHVAGNVYSALSARKGTVSARFVIHGVAHGSPFTFAYDVFDAGAYVYWRAADPVGDAIRSIQGAPGPKRFTSISFDGWVDQALRTASLARAEVRAPSAPTYATRRSLGVRRGDVVDVRVRVTPRKGAPFTKVVHLSIPNEATGDGRITVRPGSSELRVRGETFEQVLARMNAAERRSELIVQLRMRGVPVRSIRVPTDLVLGGTTTSIGVDLRK
jgi:hypothetical protein